MAAARHAPRAAAAARARAARRGGGRARARTAVAVSASASDGKTAVVAGATGYIGKFVVRELVTRGYDVVALARPRSGVGAAQDEAATRAALPGADVRFCEVTDPASVAAALEGLDVDVGVSCLASRTGGVKDSWAIDYEATRDFMDAVKAAGASGFVLLSAICVQKPLLAFQQAKLKFEEELIASGLNYSIVRPTAFFKSLAGQVDVAKGGGPYVMFGDGQLASCKPISEADLARYMADCIEDPALQNKVLPIGGPDEALSALQQGTMLFELLGKEPSFVKVPIEVMDTVIAVFDFLAGFFPNLKDGAEFGKIGRYYAAESMLVLNEETGEYDASLTPSYGTDTLRAFFANAIENGLEGQELGDQAVFK